MTISNIFHSVLNRNVSENIIDKLITIYNKYDRTTSRCYRFRENNVQIEMLLIPLSCGTKVVLYSKRNDTAILVSFEVIQENKIINYFIDYTCLANKKPTFIIHKTSETTFVDMFLDDISDFDGASFTIKDNQITLNSINIKKRHGEKNPYYTNEVIRISDSLNLKLCSIIASILEEKTSLDLGFQEIKELIFEGENKNENNKLIY